MACATASRMTDETPIERRAGKPPEDAHPTLQATETDPSDYADPRVAQPGEDPVGEDAMRPVEPPSADDE
ncbi:MAG TPA: hypothetical protein VHR55_02420 [Candidatus Limnocylindria bacterium]|nr:hypothetical protein [Candidatus Limnocylindria bacterium]